MDAFQERTISEDFHDCETATDNEQCREEGGWFCAAGTSPLRGQTQADVEGSCLKYEKGGKKKQMTPDEGGQLPRTTGHETMNG